MNVYGGGRGNVCTGRGDYYRGDYYRGDPGLLGFLGKVGKAALGFATGGVGGALRTLAPPPPPDSTVTRTRISAIPPTYEKSMTVYNGGPPQLPAPMQFPLQYQYCFTRTGKPGRLNKTGYWVNPGVYIPPRTKCVPHRRMNVCNPRALRRALRRAQGFSKLAKRFVRISATFKKGKRGRKR